jgi:hypothetical protein
LFETEIWDICSQHFEEEYLALLKLLEKYFNDFLKK